MKYIVYLKGLEYIQYKCRRCARKKCAQCQCIYQFPASYSPETLQEAPLGSLCVGAVEIRHIIVPDRCQRRQEALKRVLATPGVFLHFFTSFLRRGGLWGCLYLFQVVLCRWSASKGKIYASGQKPLAYFGTSCASDAMGFMWQHRGAIRE